MRKISHARVAHRRNLTSIIDPLGKATTLFGQPITTTDPLGHTTTFTYDTQGNLATTVDPLGHATGFQYDLVSRLIRQTDPRSKPTAFAYDALNQITTITEALGGVTRLTFDPNGNLLTLTDARGNAITHTYDTMDRLATRTDPVGAGESFTYDPAGNLIRRVDRKGQVSTFLYDALNRLTSSSYADGSGTSLAYDAAGRLVRVDDSIGGTLTNAYDTLDRLLAQSTTLGTVSYQYDALGRRTHLNVPGVVPTTYAYDANSRLTQILQGTQLLGFQYDDAGRRTLLTLPHGVSTEYQYDLASRLTALIYRNAAGLLGNLAYQYDPAGNRTQVGGSFARTLLPTPIASATYDAANRQRLFGDKSITFDANGNLTAITDATQATRLTWDARDRLIGVEEPGTLASFAYAFGRRLAKSVNGAAAQFLYDGLDIIQQVEAQQVTSYLRSLAIDETLGLTNPDGAFFLITDALGSTVAVSDASGSAVTQYTYDTFGAVSATNPAFPNPFQYTGRENDGLAGLYYYRARYYHSALQRFISEDPIGFAGGDLNLYGYVANNPLSFVDPLGLDRRDQLAERRGCDFAAVYTRTLKQNVNETNALLFSKPATVVKFGLGLAFGTGAVVARSTGTVSPLEGLKSVLLQGRGIANLTIGATLASAGTTALVNAALSAVALETGIIVGSSYVALGQALAQCGF